MSVFEKLEMSVQDFLRMFSNIILHNYLGKLGDPQSHDCENDFLLRPIKVPRIKLSKIFCKGCLFPRKLRAFLNHTCGKAFCKTDFRNCFAKSLQSILILHC